MKRKLNSPLSILGFILIILATVLGIFLYIRSFGLWNDMIGFWGYIIAAFFAPDLILIIIRIIKYGFSDWYFWTFVSAGALYWTGAVVSQIAVRKSDIKSRHKNDGF